MIPIIKTFKFLKEHRTKNAPISFIDEEGKIYYVKYVQAEKEFDCLVYEVVCNRLSTLFDINTPDPAFVHITENSLDTNVLQNHGNKIFFKSNIIAFGTLDIGFHDMVTKFSKLSGKVEFRKYDNPCDMIKIAMFDMHVANNDRWEENFNILIKHTAKKEIYAIDHYDTFGGLSKLGTFNSNLSHDINATALRSDFFYSMLKFMGIDEMISAIENYIYICNQQVIINLIDEIFLQIPIEWSISNGLKDRIVSLLMNENRLNDIEQNCKNFVYQNKPRF